MVDAYILKVNSYDDLNNYYNNINFNNIDFHPLNNVFNDMDIKNKKILVKPNVLGPYKPERCATTNPIFLKWILLYLVSRGVNKNNIIVGDSSGFNTEKSFEKSGLKKVCEDLNIKYLPFEKDEIVNFNIMNNTVPLPKSLIDSDLIINLPKLKTHILMKYTGALKNLYGVIPGGLKPKLHGVYPKEKDFGKFLVELYKTVVNIMDGIYGMEGDGPSNGTPINSKVVIFSKDTVLTDIVGSAYMGYDYGEIITNKLLLSTISNNSRVIFLDSENNNFNDNNKNNKNNFNINDNDNKNKVYSINEIDKINIRINKKLLTFKKPITYRIISIFPPFLVKYIFSLMIQKPTIDKNKCVKCGVCEKICPVNAIIKKENHYHINRKKCINCYCCHEMCGYGAIKLKNFFGW